MAAIHDLLAQVQDEALRARLEQEINRLSKTKKFGLVFEEHLPECTPLYDIPVKRGSTVAKKTGAVSEMFEVNSIKDGVATCYHKVTEEKEEIPVDELVCVAQLGEPIYPYLKPIDSVCNAPDSDLWHTLIESDNYHALQLLEYLYAGKVDCIYIDPPYNTGARDWKYNNDYVDVNDAYRHSKWLSFMKRRLKIAEKLLNPEDSVLIVTIDEKEYLHLGCLLEELFPYAKIQMVSSVINSGGAAREQQFFRTDEYIFICEFGKAYPQPLPLGDEWAVKADKRTNEVSWRMSLVRGGSNASRDRSPGCFYPIFVSEDGSKIISVGEPLGKGNDRNSVIPPEGTIAIWPLRTDGSEGVWQMSPNNLREAIANGYVRLGRFTKTGMAISYLNRKEIEKVNSPGVKIIGRRTDGSIITDDSNFVREYIPGTQWRINSHNARVGGTNILKQIFGDNIFSYPKSVYAVKDVIRFFVNNKPNALIVDFFAGSGTTMHAVSLLNAEDGGHRRCICVTNNEVSDSKSKSLRSKGFKPGDEEWDALGIARYITWPRIVSCIKGIDVNGKPLEGNYGVEDEDYVKREEEGHTGCYKKGKKQLYPKLALINMKDGLKDNAAFFKLGFLDKTSVALGRQLAELFPVLWLKAGAHGPCPQLEDNKARMVVLPENHFAILMDEKHFQEFDAEVQKHPEIQTIYIVTDSEAGYREMISGYAGKDTFQLYRDYLDNFRINTGR